MQEKFRAEIKIMARKYPTKAPTQLIKLLFHGSSNTDPRSIYNSEEGLDMRFSRAGMYGQGIYFADNSKYSIRYAFPVPRERNVEEFGVAEDIQLHQMFVCFVAVGNPAELKAQDGSLRMPPLIEGGNGKDQVARYDSVVNAKGDHTIIYTNSR